MTVGSGRAWNVRGLGVLASLVLAVACDGEGAREASGGTALAPAAAVEPEVRSGSDAPADAPMTGVLVPEAEVVLVSSGFARLARLDVQVGDHVEKGEVVAEMDVRGDRSELQAATAAWKASRAELDRLALELEEARATRSDVERLEEFVSKAELREKQFAEKLTAARKRSAGAALEEQRSKMQEASARIAEAELRAPFSGFVARRHVDPGATLGTGEPVVQLISDARLVRFAVPEHRAKALRLGAEVIVAFEDEGIEVAGQVSTIAPEIEAGTRLVLAEARVRLDDAQAEALRVGTVGRVRFAGR
jgi:membrane fusion protein, multidrug efflux system